MLTFIVILYVALLLPGLLFYFKPPRQISRLYGYRTNRARKNPENWAYANKLAGKLLLIFIHLAALFSLLSVSILHNRVSLDALFLIVIFWFAIFPVIIVPVVEYKLSRFEKKQHSEG